MDQRVFSQATPRNERAPTMIISLVFNKPAMIISKVNKPATSLAKSTVEGVESMRRTINTYRRIHLSTIDTSRAHFLWIRREHWEEVKGRRVILWRTFSSMKISYTMSDPVITGSMQAQRRKEEHERQRAEQLKQQEANMLRFERRKQASCDSFGINGPFSTRIFHRSRIAMWVGGN